MSKEIKNTISKATDSLMISRSCIGDLYTMFEAIQCASNEGSQAHKLAIIGCLLADEYVCTVDSNVEEFKALGGGA